MLTGYEVHRFKHKYSHKGGRDGDRIHLCPACKADCCGYPQTCCRCNTSHCIFLEDYDTRTNEAYAGNDLSGHAGGIAGGTVIALSGLGGQTVVVSSFVIEPVHALHGIDHAPRVTRVAAVGIGAGGIGIGGELGIGDDEPFGGHEVLPLPETVHEVVWHPMVSGGRRDDVPQLGLFVEQKSHGGHAVQQRECGDGNGVVLIDDALVGRDDVELELERALVAKVVKHFVHQFSSPGKGVDGHCAGTRVQCHGGKKSENSEHMVAVQMADKDVVEAAEVETLPAEGRLRSLAAVNHEEVVAHVEHLARGRVTPGGGGRAAT